jgi:hypothetical protein
MAWAKGGGREKNAETLLDIGIDLITARLGLFLRLLLILQYILRCSREDIVDVPPIAIQPTLFCLRVWCRGRATIESEQNERERERAIHGSRLQVRFSRLTIVVYRHL